MRFLIFSVLLSIIPSLASAQTEIGLFAGISNYYGDVSPNLRLAGTHPAVGLNLKRNISPYFAFGIGANYGRISGDDAHTKSQAVRKLAFRSDIQEITAQFEVNFFKFGRWIGAKHFSPYLFSGFSIFHFDPMAEYNGSWVHLQQMRTEGQGVIPGTKKPYDLWSYAIPVGGGFKYNFNDHWNGLISCGFRTSFTDYLDDVSTNYPNQALLSENLGERSAALSNPSNSPLNTDGRMRGSTDTKDWFLFAGFTLSYIIQGPACYSF